MTGKNHEFKQIILNTLKLWPKSKNKNTKKIKNEYK